MGAPIASPSSGSGRVDASDERDLGARHAKIGELAVGQARQLADGFAIAKVGADLGSDHGQEHGDNPLVLRGLRPGSDEFVVHCI